MTSPPTQSLTIDKTVQLTLKTTSKEAYDALKKRSEEYEQTLIELAAKKSQVEGALRDAAERGLCLVNITKPWSEHEQCRFLKGLRCYQGGPREAYCSSVCLTESFIHHATLMDLAIAARNVKLGSKDPTPIDYNVLDAAALRKRLFMFLKYC